MLHRDETFTKKVKIGRSKRGSGLQPAGTHSTTRGSTARTNYHVLFECEAWLECLV